MAIDSQEHVDYNDSLPEKVVRFDVVRVEYGRQKICRCVEPHYEIDYQNRLVCCRDCGAVIDPFEALMRIAIDTKRWDDYTERMLEQRRQIRNYQPRRTVIKDLEKQYISAERSNLEPTCPNCGHPFALKELLKTRWVNREFAKKISDEESPE